MQVADKFNTPSGSAASHRRIEFEQQLVHAMAHWFNHQTSHRGQVKRWSSICCFPGAGSP